MTKARFGAPPAHTHTRAHTDLVRHRLCLVFSPPLPCVLTAFALCSYRLCLVFSPPLPCVFLPPLPCVLTAFALCSHRLCLVFLPPPRLRTWPRLFSLATCIQVQYDRADLWSIGCILHFVLTKQSLYAGKHESNPVRHCRIALCVSTAFVAETLPLPCVSTDFVAKTHRLCLVCFYGLRGQDTAFASRLSSDTAFACCVPTASVAKTHRLRLAVVIRSTSTA